MSTGPTRAKRKQSARELAERFGVSPRTIRRTVAQERAEGLSMRAIAAKEGVTVGTVHYAIHKDD